ncbi:hypothetical protein [Streptomyces sp. JHA26]|uniref:hypothetical protein n=1 Tax=Streptomyces sp. JHA26 TaxID=1917143 RepID=UPI00117C8A73|nr:hypothetical protein [Streptomyces sp. JHA26]
MLAIEYRRHGGYEELQPPGEPLLACGMAWITYHLPGPRRPDGRRGYLDGVVTGAPAAAATHAASWAHWSAASARRASTTSNCTPVRPEGRCTKPRASSRARTRAWT